MESTGELDGELYRNEVIDPAIEFRQETILLKVGSV